MISPLPVPAAGCRPRGYCCPWPFASIVHAPGGRGAGVGALAAGPDSIERSKQRSAEGHSRPRRTWSRPRRRRRWKQSPCRRPPLSSHRSTSPCSTRRRAQTGMSLVSAGRRSPPTCGPATGRPARPRRGRGTGPSRSH